MSTNKSNVAGYKEVMSTNKFNAAGHKIKAEKATQLALNLLGMKVSDDVLLAQASDFMRLGQDSLDRSLARCERVADKKKKKKKKT